MPARIWEGHQLKFSRVLVTRPEPDCSSLATILRENGLDPIKLPAFSFKARKVQAGENWWPKEPRVAIFTSPRAVEFGVQSLLEAALKNIAVAAMGKATARALEDQGLDVDLVPDGGVDSEALLRSPIFTGKAGSVVIFAAPGGRNVLREVLEAKGWAVSVTHVYERELVAPSAEVIQRLEAVGPCVSIWTSSVAMEFMQEKLKGRAWDNILAGVMIVISPRLSGLAGKMGARDVRIASGPGNDELSQCALEASG